MVKRKKIKDPNAEQEAQRYQNPIPSRECILDHFESMGEPLSFEKLLKLLSLDEPQKQEALQWRLQAMVRDGQLIKTRAGKFGLTDRLDLIRGYVVGHPDGHGFLVPDDNSQDLFLSPRQMRQVFNGDQVLGRTIKHHRGRNKREAAIVRVLERKHKQIVGRFFIESGAGFVVPDNKRLTQDIIIPESEQNNAQEGQVVSAEITAYPTMRNQAVGKISEVLGGHMAPGMETDIAIRAHDIPYDWPEAVLDETAVIPETVTEEDLVERQDLRHLPFITIDGEDARDFDDAVYCEKRKRSGWILYVAIADVSHYVKPGSALDQEALTRGNSTYFPTRVVPMLPEKLSNGLCSLNPQVDRLVLVCEMQLTGKGKMQRYQFYPAVIHSQARLTYDSVVSMLLDGDEKLQQQHQAVFPHLQNLYQVYQLLHAYRQQQGAIDFDLSEPKVIFDENEKIRSLEPLVRNDAHRLIEECMLCANVASAKFLLKAKNPGIYRIHQGPKPDKIEDLLVFLGELGLGLSGGTEPSSADYAKLLEQIQQRPDKHLIQTVLLRSLMQAEYSTENIGHFGLGFDAYTHFTSPIRRYPDLLVHRLIKKNLAKKKLNKEEKQQLPKMAAHCSMTERRSDEATRDVLSWLKCEFMMDKVGEHFSGIISSVTGFGLFIGLQDVYVEGLVHISNLENDYYHYDAIRHRLIGQASGRTYRIGDKVEIRVDRVDLEQRQIDFGLIQPKAKAKTQKKQKQRRR